MGSILTNGVFLPAEGERNCYEGLAANWTALDRLIGGYNAHIGNATIHVTAADKQAWNGKADASALTAHTGDTTIHVTAADKQAWDGHVADSVKHVTAEDKAKWDAVTSKANDSDVVHKSGNETIRGVKTFNDNIIRGNTTITSGIITGKGNTSTVGSNGVGYLQNHAYLIYQDSTPTKDVKVTLEVQDSNYTDGKSRAFFPNSNNTINLGKSGKRWANVYATNYYYGGSEIEFSTKFVTTDTAQTISGNKTFSSINGVEPGSVSLPNLSAGVDISGYITNLNKGVNTYTPPANGWLSVRVKKTSLSHTSLMIYQTDGLLSSCEADEYDISGTNLPVIANRNVEIYIYADVLVEAKFYPCQGNL